MCVVILSIYDIPKSTCFCFQVPVYGRFPTFMSGNSQTHARLHPTLKYQHLPGRKNQGIAYHWRCSTVLNKMSLETLAGGYLRICQQERRTEIFDRIARISGYAQLDKGPDFLGFRVNFRYHCGNPSGSLVPVTRRK